MTQAEIICVNRPKFLALLRDGKLEEFREKTGITLTADEASTIIRDHGHRIEAAVDYKAGWR